MNIRIYDIDGTLTKVKGDNLEPDDFDTYAFWPLLSYYFAKDPAKLKAIAEAWDKSDKGVGEHFIQSSHNMLQVGIEHFYEDVMGEDIEERARDLTLEFIDNNIIRLEAIAHLRAALEAGDLCILSTGSYEDGVYGFIVALIERSLLPADALEKIVISGAVVDWNAPRSVLHANIADNKILGLYQACENYKYEFNVEDVVGIYADDPWGNDSGLCSLKPECVRLVETVKNKDKIFKGILPISWSDIYNLESKPACGFRH